MNIKIYQAAKGNYCLYVTNSAKDRYRVSTELKSELETKKLVKRLERMLPLSKSQIKSFIDGCDSNQHSEEKRHTFEDVFHNFLSKSELEKQWTYNTVKHFVSLGKVIKEHFGNMLIEDMCKEEWLYSYISWRGTLTINTTLQKEVKSIKQFFRFVQKSGIADCSSLLAAKPKFKKASKPNVVFLTKEELKTLMDAEIETPYLCKTKDLFLFSCMTGLRYSDTQLINRTNVTGRVLHFTTKKTDDTLTIPLNDVAFSILEKYDYSLPKMQNQVVNRFVKEMCRVVGINTPTTIIHYKGSVRIEETEPKWKLISSHSARKTFISNALMLGVPVPTLMSMTGHKSYQVMQTYVAVADDAKVNATNALSSIFD